MRHIVTLLIVALAFTIALGGASTIGAPKAPKPASVKKPAPKVQHQAKKPPVKAKAKAARPKKVAKPPKKAAPKPKAVAKGKVRLPLHKPKEAHHAEAGKKSRDKDERAKKINDKKIDEWRRVTIEKYKREREVNTRHFAYFDKNRGEWSFNSHWWSQITSHSSSYGSESFSSQAGFPANDPLQGGDSGATAVNAAIPAVNAVAPPVIKRDEALPTGRDAGGLAAVLDGLDVEHHWLPGCKVYWKTGSVENDGEGPASNAGAFVAAVCVRMKVPMSNGDFSPGTQYDWLAQEGKAKGWLMVADVEAQLLANQGWVVIAAWKNLAAPGERTVSGQTAVVRPSKKPVDEIAECGPRLTLAGLQNCTDASVKESFPAPAWDNHEVAYFAHWSR